MDLTRHLVLVALFLSCALADSNGPQFAYSATTFHQPYVPLPLARFHEDFFGNQIDRSPYEASAPQPGRARLPPSPYHFIPATLPRAIYSEPAHILSGYSYQTLDPAGAKSQVLFVSGPNSQQLFRQNADLLHIVLPALFTADGDNAIPRSVPALDTAKIPEQTYPATEADPTVEADPAITATVQTLGDEVSSGEASPSTGSNENENQDDGASAETKSGEDNPSHQEDVKPTEIHDDGTKKSLGEDTSTEESDKSSEEEGSTSRPTVTENDNDAFKIDVSTSEASNSLKTIPLEADSLESASTEAPTTSATHTSDDKSENQSDGLKSDEKTSEENNTQGKASQDDQTTESTVTSTTLVPAE